MRQRRVTEFYRNLWIAALIFVGACVTTRAPGPELTTVFLVRHGEKSTAVPNDADPDLSAAGRVRAEALAARLRAVGITAIITTQLKRTRETAQPLADQLQLTPEIVPTGATHPDRVAAAVLRHRGGKMLVVGHSNTLGAIIATLGGPRLPNLCDDEYSDLFVMNISSSPPPSLVRQHYGATDPRPDSVCATMQVNPLPVTRYPLPDVVRPMHPG